jgi:arsenical pump membrane protein
MRGLFRSSERARTDTISSRSDPLRAIMWVAAVALVAIAGALRSGRLGSAATATLGPFLTLAAVIVTAAILDTLGVFRWVARQIVPDTTGPRSAFGRVLVVTALISGLVNLDVAVVVAMPVALRVARRTDLAAGAMAIAVAVTANASSILLPTSNLTNLLVLERARLGFVDYVRVSWIPWVGVATLAVTALTLVLGRPRARNMLIEPVDRVASVGAVLDLVPLFAAAVGIRALLGSGVFLPGGFAEQTGLGSVLAAGINNLPAAAGVHALSTSSAWAEILAMAIGSNLLVTGSLATVICRRLARDGGADLDPIQFSIVGLTLTPILLMVAFVGLHISGAV